jgi:hypothetical protein
MKGGRGEGGRGGKRGLAGELAVEFGRLGPPEGMDLGKSQRVGHPGDDGFRRGSRAQPAFSSCPGGGLINVSNKVGYGAFSARFHPRLLLCPLCRHDDIVDSLTLQLH